VSEEFDFSKLQSGPYLLDAPVDNPKSDGRCKDDWTAAVQFPAGRYIVAMSHEAPEDELTVERQEFYVSRGTGTKTCIRFRRQGETEWHWGHSDASKYAEGTLALLRALVPDDSVDGLLRYWEKEHNVQQHDLLVRLVGSGAVSRDALAVAHHAQREADDREAEEQERKWEAKLAQDNADRAAKGAQS
jgi:hypothetical protein